MSIAVRRSLASQLKQLRLDAKKSQADVAESGIMVVETIRKIERAEHRIKPNYVKQLCELYGTDLETTHRLMEMAKNVEKGGWWENYSDVMDPKFRFYVRLETEADQMSSYDTELPYGVLQTPAYHRAIFEANPAVDQKILNQQIEFRQERQRATLGRTPPLRICTVLNEAILVREVGGHKVMAELREHLLKLTSQPAIDLYVLPWQAGEHAAMGGPFQIVGFDSPATPDVVYLETYEGVRYLEAGDRLRIYRDRFDRVLRQSVPLEEYLR
jgi:transcriptional regulator with XRE-family HTH domain